MTENTSYLSRQHPVRSLLEACAQHRTMPTRADLDRLEAVGAATLPDGQSFAGLRSKITEAARQAIEAGAHGDNAAARAKAAEWAAHLAEGMTPQMRAVDTSDPNPEPLDNLAARMFRH